MGGLHRPAVREHARPRMPTEAPWATWTSCEALVVTSDPRPYRSAEAGAAQCVTRLRDQIHWNISQPISTATAGAQDFTVKLSCTGVKIWKPSQGPSPISPTTSSSATRASTNPGWSGWPRHSKPVAAVFLDKWNLVPGSNWVEGLHRGVESSQAAVLVAVSRGQRYQGPVIQALLDSIRISGSG
jgi:hypothetical protein